MNDAQRVARNIAELKQLVDAETLKITLIVGPSRSVTTALAGALAQSKDVGIDNVFHECLSGDHFLDKLSEVMTTAENSTSPKHIIIKEMYDGDASKALADVCEHVIFTTREPIQLSVANMGDKLHVEEMRNIAIQQNSHTPSQNSVTMLSTPMSECEEMRNATQSLASEIADIPSPPPISFVDGDLFRAQPEAALQTLAARSNIAFGPQMVSGWSKTHETIDPWCKTYENSTAIKKPVQVTPASQALIKSTKSLRSQIRSYMDMVSSDHMIKPDLETFVNSTASVLCGKGNDLRFDHLSPTTAYALAASYVPENNEQKTLRRNYLKDLKQEFGEQHSDYFETVDEWVLVTRQPKAHVRNAQPLGTQREGGETSAQL